MRILRHFLFFAAPVLASSGCGNNDPTSGDSCTAEFVYGITVMVKDSVTGAFAGSGARLVAREGEFADTSSLAPNDPNVNAFVLKAAGERSGLYSLTVSKAGYRDWTRANVRVLSDQAQCHVIPVSLTALLQPGSP